MDPVTYERARLSPEVPTRDSLTKAELETSDKVDIVKVDTSSAAVTLDFLPTDFPDGHLLVLRISSVNYSLTFDRVIGDATSSKNIRIPDNVGTPTLDELGHKAVFRWHKGSTVADGHWDLEYGNFNSHIQYDRANDTWGYGGDADSSTKHKFTGDILIEDGTGEAVLTIIHTGEGGSDSAVLRLHGNAATAILKDLNGATDDKQFNMGMDAGNLSFAFYTDAGVLKQINLQLTTDGAVLMPELPTSDPTVAGELWNDSGTLKVSAG